MMVPQIESRRSMVAIAHREQHEALRDARRLCTTHGSKHYACEDLR
jgi:hypothetical protein